MTKTIYVNNPPEECKNCHSSRIGIQEGRIFFRCGSSFDTNINNDDNNWIHTEKCETVKKALTA